MTKERLKKEAEDFLQKKWGTSKMLILGGDAREVLADFAEPFVEPIEKQIQIDAEQIRALQKQNGELTDKVRELEKELQIVKQNKHTVAHLGECIEQIQDKKIAELEELNEKMKCCGNCKFYNKKYFRCEKTLLTLKSGLCHNFDKWEIKKND